MKTRALMILSCIALLSPALAQAQAMKPLHHPEMRVPAAEEVLHTVRTADGIEYLSGGIGDDEMAELHSASARFNGKLTFAEKDGAYVSSVALKISSAAGKPVLVAEGLGPIVLVKLPAGSYQVEATYLNRTETTRLTVGAGKQAQAVLRW